MVKENKILILAMRNYGDAVIITSIIESLAKSFSNIKIDVFTRPLFKDIFTANPHINNICYAQFPLWRCNQLKPIQLINMIRKCIEMRKRKYDLCINIVGDFRENIIAKLIKPTKNISIIFEAGHPFLNITKYNHWFNNISESIKIPKEIINYYDIIHFMIKEIGGNGCLPPRIYINDSKFKDNIIIGIHPLASEECRLWEFVKWSHLIENLIRDGLQISVFCSPREKNYLYSNLKSVLKEPKVSLFAEPLGDFIKRLAQVSLLIGLDSFSIHLAYALNVPSIMLNGANDHRIYTPKNSYVIYNSGNCEFYPCYNKPKCLEYNRYKCIKEITPDEILEVIRGKLT